MKILITGGYGFIGSAITSRFVKEGSKIFIIDNKKENKRDFEHYLFQIDVADKKCEGIFKAAKFDIVIHLAATDNDELSLLSPYYDSHTNIMGLVNMLELSHKYNVKKFVYISSASVYGNAKNLPIDERYNGNPVTPNGVSKYMGEYYVSKLSEMYKLKYVCFRASNVYGPGGNGVISTFIDKIITGQDLIIYGDGNQTRDFIYIEDVAEAIYIAVTSDLEGIYNLSTNTEISLNNLVNILKNLTHVKAITYREAKQKSIKRSRLDNSSLLSESNLNIMYSLEQGLKKTFDFYQRQENIMQKKVTNYNAAKVKLLPFIPYIFNYIGFAFLTIAYLYFGLGMHKEVVSLGLFYIFLIGVKFGIKQSLIASFMTIFAYILNLVVNGTNLSAVLLNQLNVSIFFFMLTVGYVSGYTFEKSKRIMEEKESKINSLEEQYNLLHIIFEDTNKIKEKYQEQILSNEDSFNKIFNIVMALENLEPIAIYNSSITVLEDILKNKSIIIHVISENRKFARVVAHSKKAAIEGRRSIKLDEYVEYMITVKTGEIYSNVELKKDIPSLIGAVVDRENIIALVSVYDVEFEKMNYNYINLFKMLIKLISHALSRAYRFEDAMRKEYYFDDTFILKAERFKIILQQKIEAHEKFATPYTLLKVSCSSNEKLLSTAHFVLNQIRETDYLGKGDHNDLLLLLSNTKKADSKLLIQRLEKRGIKSCILDEEESNQCLILL